MDGPGRLVIDRVQQYKKDREGDRRSVAYKWATAGCSGPPAGLTTEPGVLPRWGRYSNTLGGEQGCQNKEPNKAKTSGNVLKNYYEAMWTDKKQHPPTPKLKGSSHTANVIWQPTHVQYASQGEIRSTR
ncbi:hypothetical protein MGG_16888 [Pyricularia oryzae 70-15]|uniref:Uncharacterized protein n=3 Tax=Pyricularia oryzae TaxID=318829 RepID=G4N5A8_PYRO7|nr:uncharacterized protein MGG_16888 [Pyricularia oryzae 70-15]EHA52965.1 hypothetical protein MGG_16888 [Pyricularia oryzae 70-15]ELQ38810.1 hypothetical protein OOU_Y34scaffold00526g8 [Pyricularia oryzae Y34]